MLGSPFKRERIKTTEQMRVELKKIEKAMRKHYGFAYDNTHWPLMIELALEGVKWREERKIKLN